MMVDGTALGWAAGLGALGAIVGSFVATLVIRWAEGRSVVAGRSACDACARTLGVRDLVPVLSFVVLRGRCRTCRAAIGREHLLVELIAASIGVSAGLASPGLPGVAGAVFGWLLLALGGLDYRAFWLPDRLTAALGLGGLGAGAAGLAPALGERLIGGAAGFAVLSTLAFIYRRVRGREGMGGGDPKLLGAIGLWLGWRMLPAVLLVASLIGLGGVLTAAALRRPLARDDAVPFGTLLAAAAYPAWVAMLGWGG